MISAKGFFKYLIALLLVTPVAGLAQSLTAEMHHVDSVMVELQAKYDPYHLLRIESEHQQSLLVNRYGHLKANPNAFKIPGVVWVPDQKGLFEDRKSARNCMEITPLAMPFSIPHLTLSPRSSPPKEKPRRNNLMYFNNYK